MSRFRRAFTCMMIGGMGAWCAAERTWTQESQAPLPNVNELLEAVQRFERSCLGLRIEFLVSYNGTDYDPASVGYLECAADGRYRRSTVRWKNSEGKAISQSHYRSFSRGWWFSVMCYPDEAWMPRGALFGVESAEGEDVAGRGTVGGSLFGEFRGFRLSEHLARAELSVAWSRQEPTQPELTAKKTPTERVRIVFNSDRTPQRIEYERGKAGEGGHWEAVVFGPYEYRHIAGRTLPWSVADRSTSSNPANEGNGGIRVTAVAPFDEKLTERIQFREFEVPDGTQVLALHEPGVRCAFRRGKVVRLGDRDSIERAEDARFRNPHPTFGLRNAVLGIVALALVAVLIWVRTRRNR